MHQDGGLQVVRNDEKMEEALDLCGDYVIKTDKTLAADELWKLYMTLLKAEAGLRMLKGSLGLRPNDHQLEGRVDGHVFISVLAYHLLSWVLLVEHALYEGFQFYDIGGETADALGGFFGGHGIFIEGVAE